MRLLPNPGAAAPGEPFPAELEPALGDAPARRAWRVLTGRPDYAPTPLRLLPGLAAALGMAEVRAKDESGRFGLGSFKALGGAYAVADLVQRWREAGHDPGALTVCCATAGNHGRSVAWGAEAAGCRCVIYVPAGTDASRVRRMEAHGARVVVTDGSYDRAVVHCAEQAAVNGWEVVSDTGYPGYSRIPRVVMQGYTVLAEEAVRQWPGEPPSHVFLQCGVGGLAAALCAQLWRRWGSRRPRCVVVEPWAAACMQRSAAAGRPAVVPGELQTCMSCLACGEVSTEAWPVLRRGADHFLTVTDAEAAEAVERLARGEDGDPRIASAPSGAAGLAGLLAATREPALREALALDATSRVLLVVSEGAVGDTAGARE